MNEPSAQPRFLGVDIVNLFFCGLGVVWAALAVAVFQPTFLSMLEDFGGALPAFTMLFLRPVVPPALALIAPACAGAAIGLNAPRPTRVVAMAGSIVLALLLPVGFLLSMYLPITVLAGAVK